MTDKIAGSNEAEKNYLENLPPTDDIKFTKTEFIILGICALIIALMILIYQFIPQKSTPAVKYESTQPEQASEPDNYDLQNSIF